ncbi:cytidine deaminase-like protein [Thelephora terrestris]|uniref:Deoxycytidylate deaminase n=1 Tax=Thelephora terrestris TaxID=56493 RepID=A0A9P6HGI2_9AGAM|nr:cytidine deaminase-like protein [Thelephora terrestris]
MFIVIVGTMYSGKSTLEDYLVSRHGFTSIHLESANHYRVWSRNPREILDHVTRDWRNNYVTAAVLSTDELREFAIRPFVLIVSVDAPILERFRRMTRYRTLSLAAHLRIDNPFLTVPEFQAHLESVDLLNVERLRPHWDTYFMHLASLASRRSNCMKRRVGAILVRNNRVVATGYNGTPRGLRNCNDGGCPRCNTGGSSGHDLDQCVCLHAEENALLESGRERLEDTVLYCNTCPCLGCSVKIIQCGVKEVVYHLGYKVDDGSAALFREAGVTIRRHAPPDPL